MIPPLHAIKKIVLGNIKLDGKVIPIIQRNYPQDTTPCITVDDSGGSSLSHRLLINEEYPLDNNHPQYDSNNPFKKYPQEVIREYHQTTINLNVWADSGDELDELNKLVQNLFNEAQADHYKFCKNYNEGYCAYMDNTCFAEHFLNNKSVKNQCPNPKLYGYENVFETYNLIRSSFYLDQPYTLIDRNMDKNIYRSIMKLHTGYYVDHIIGGLINNNLNEDSIIL